MLNVLMCVTFGTSYHNNIYTPTVKSNYFHKVWRFSLIIVFLTPVISFNMCTIASGIPTNIIGSCVTRARGDTSITT